MNVTTTAISEQELTGLVVNDPEAIFNSPELVSRLTEDHKGYLVRNATRVVLDGVRNELGSLYFEAAVRNDPEYAATKWYDLTREEQDWVTVHAPAAMLAERKGTREQRDIATALAPAAAIEHNWQHMTLQQKREAVKAAPAAALKHVAAQLTTEEFEYAIKQEKSLALDVAAEQMTYSQRGIAQGRYIEEYSMYRR